MRGIFVSLSMKERKMFVCMLHKTVNNWNLLRSTSHVKQTLNLQNCNFMINNIVHFNISIFE
jgi:hypothetical protein